MKKFVAMIMMLLLAATCMCFTACAEKVDYDEDTSYQLGPIAKEDLKIGVLHINPTDSTSGYTYAHEQGIRYMQRELGLSDDQVKRQGSIDDGDSAAILKALDELIADGCNLIFGTSFGYMEELQQKAKEYPEILFSHGTGYLSYKYNYNNYFGRIYQARYLSGIVAGMKASQGGSIGYVSAYGTTIAECTSGVNAFALGVQTVNPTATVYVKTLNSWWDPTNEKAYAEALLNAPYNCEVIAQHCDSDNPPVAAMEAGKFSVGYNSDMSKTQAGDSVLASVVWNWGVYYKLAVEMAIAGEWGKSFGNYYGDYSDGLFDITELSPNCAAGTQERVDAVRAIFNDKNDSWDVFSGVKLSFDAEGNVIRTNAALKKASGEEIVAAGGASVADSVITGNMPYWIEGVEYVA